MRTPLRSYGSVQNSGIFIQKVTLDGWLLKMIVMKYVNESTKCNSAHSIQQVLSPVDALLRIKSKIKAISHWWSFLALLCSSWSHVCDMWKEWVKMWKKWNRIEQEVERFTQRKRNGSVAKAVRTEWHCNPKDKLTRCKRSDTNPIKRVKPTEPWETLN